MTINILFLAANPKDIVPLRLGEEVRAIQEKLRASEHRDNFKIEQEWAVRVSDIQGHLLRHKPHIMHFSGHGSAVGEIVLEDQFGASNPVTASALRKLFTTLKDNIRCVVLNACFSQIQANAIAESIECVVGMSNTLSDEAAILFASSFYQALGFGRSIQTSFDLASLEIELHRLDQHNTPKLIANPSVDPKTIYLIESTHINSEAAGGSSKTLRPLDLTRDNPTIDI